MRLGLDDEPWARSLRFMLPSESNTGGVGEGCTIAPRSIYLSPTLMMAGLLPWMLIDGGVVVAEMKIGAGALSWTVGVFDSNACN